MLNEAEKLPEELSGGMKRRVSIARAIVDRPDIVLFDEPTAGLDPPTARSVCELMIKLRDIEGVTSMVVTHKLDDVRFLSSKYIAHAWGDEVELRSEDDQLCLINTKFIMLRDGRVIFDGTDEQLWASDDQYIRSFLLGRAGCVRRIIPFLKGPGLLARRSDGKHWAGRRPHRPLSY
jgi:phospholipid/cholesterol/gamma-HCH transport system ATP-binding protein